MTLEADLARGGTQWTAKAALTDDEAGALAKLIERARDGPPRVAPDS